MSDEQIHRSIAGTYPTDPCQPVYEEGYREGWTDALGWVLRNCGLDRVDVEQIERVLKVDEGTLGRKA